MAKRAKSVVKCPGRFSELREFFHDEAVPTVLGSKTIVREGDLKEIWGLISNDVYGYDRGDPYYQSPMDKLRKPPQLDQYSLVPLFPSTFQFEGDVF